MRILDTLHTQSDQLGFRHEFTATAGNGLVDWADFVRPKSHGNLLIRVSFRRGWTGCDVKRGH